MKINLYFIFKAQGKTSIFNSRCSINQITKLKINQHYSRHGHDLIIELSINLHSLQGA